MAILDKIEDLQKRPEPVRKRILFLSVTIIMFLVIAIWVTSLRFTLNSEREQTDYAPVKVFKDIIKDGYNFSKKGVEQFLNKIETIYGSER